MEQKDDFEESRRHLALEVLVTLSETASAMVRKVAKKYMTKLGKNKLLDNFIISKFSSFQFLNFLR